MLLKENTFYINTVGEIVYCLSATQLETTEEVYDFVSITDFLTEGLVDAVYTEQYRPEQLACFSVAEYKEIEVPLITMQSISDTFDAIKFHQLLKFRLDMHDRIKNAKPTDITGAT
jgi:hypothetical protein